MMMGHAADDGPDKYFGERPSMPAILGANRVAGWSEQFPSELDADVQDFVSGG